MEECENISKGESGNNKDNGEKLSQFGIIYPFLSLLLTTLLLFWPRETCDFAANSNFTRNEEEKLTIEELLKQKDVIGENKWV
jgi:hypothetical protein